jgi:hypothetical protein
MIKEVNVMLKLYVNGPDEETNDDDIDFDDWATNGEF